MVGENLLDREYQEVLGYPALGRAVRGGLRFRAGRCRAVKALLAWSSGKDSAWASTSCASGADVEVVGLLTTVNEAYDRVAMHAVRRALLEAQARRGRPAPARRAHPLAVPERGLRGGDGGARSTRPARPASRPSPSATCSWRTSAATARSRWRHRPRPLFPLWGGPTAALARR